MKLLNRISVSLIAVLCVVSFLGCSDDLTYPDSVCDGSEVTISLSVELPELDRFSRSDMSENDLNAVNSLWVAIYSSSTGKMNFSNRYDVTSTKTHDPYTLPDITTKSEPSYIVAVANPEAASGQMLQDDGTLGALTPLADLLKSAVTWNKFKRIILSRPTFQGAADIYNPTAPLPMCGVYYEGTTDHGVVGWDALNSTPVNIPSGKGIQKLPGAIHLRRIFSQIKFEIQAGTQDNVEVVSIEPLSYQVFNVPIHSWLLDRPHTGTGIDYANAGDNVAPDKFVNNPAYPASLSFSSANIESSDGVYSFDFWQMENKRQGILAGAGLVYQNREREYKTGDEQIANGAANTGIFSSLSPIGGDLNNLATYVDIKCNITYRNKTTEGDNPPGMDDLPTGALRNAVAVYRIHLGYVNPDPDANDFNSLRNSVYTYRVTVTSVKNIIVEAYREGENQPGAEGTVTDVTNRLEQLDAHSGVFNIYLSDEELKSFTFSMTSYYDFQPKSVSIDENGKWTRPQATGSEPAIGDDDFKFYNWIEFVPTGITTPGSDDGTNIPTAIAPYPDLTTGTSTIAERRKGKVYYCGELREAALAGDLAGQWFTVYVNEYSYEKRYGEVSDELWGNEEGNEWKNYVNQPDRHAWFNVSQSTSGDGKSAYFKSKYALIQKSIQTYYNYDYEGTENAVGLEHLNECFGMNLRWTETTDGLNPDNGRYNVWRVAGGSDVINPNWDDFVLLNESQQVKEITNTFQTAPANIPTAARTSPLPNIRLIPTDDLTDADNGTQSYLEYDPQNREDPADNQYIETIFACMNRNRDENGNGVIDKSELKWYVPTSGKLVRVILGRNVLTNPIMTYTQPYLPTAAGDGYNTLFHFGTSDNKIMWTEEGMSSNYFADGPINRWRYAPWQVRCIRNLGTNLHTVIDEERVEPAYREEINDETHGGLVKVLHYYGTALRPNQVDPLPMHKSNDDYNKLGLYGFEIAPRGNNFANISTLEANPAYRTDRYQSPASYATYLSYINNATPCNTLNNGTGGANGRRKGWRIPNQKEIVIMLRLGIFGASQYTFPNNGFWYGMSCTQEFYSSSPDGNGRYVGSETTGEDYRQLTVEISDTEKKLADGSTIPFGVGIATAIGYNYIYFVRCVRDLTAAEANMNYQQILNYTTN